MIAAHCRAASDQVRTPVKIIYDRMEDMAATTKRHPSRHAAPDGRQQRWQRSFAAKIEFTIDGGAYLTLSPVVLSRGAIHAAGTVLLPIFVSARRRSRTNVPPHGLFGGFGAPQSLFALERHMDRIAQGGRSFSG